MAKPKITLYVDIVSPFAYLAYYILRHHPSFAADRVDVAYVPILLGGLMKACNNQPPLLIRNKDRWVVAQRTRWATQFNIPLAAGAPPGFPQPTLSTMRALAYIELNYAPAKLVEALDALYEAHWVHANADVARADGARAVLEAKRVFAAADLDAIVGGSAEAKKRLLENTDQSFRDGAFGLPWFQCTNARGQVDGFWGFDNLGQVIRFLDLDRGDDVALKALL